MTLAEMDRELEIIKNIRTMSIPELEAHMDKCSAKLKLDQETMIAHNKDVVTITDENKITTVNCNFHKALKTFAIQKSIITADARCNEHCPNTKCKYYCPF